MLGLSPLPTLSYPGKFVVFSALAVEWLTETAMRYTPHKNPAEGFIPICFSLQ